MRTAARRRSLDHKRSRMQCNAAPSASVNSSGVSAASRAVTPNSGIKFHCGRPPKPYKKKLCGLQAATRCGGCRRTTHLPARSAFVPRRPAYWLPRQQTRRCARVQRTLEQSCCVIVQQPRMISQRITLCALSLGSATGMRVEQHRWQTSEREVQQPAPLEYTHTVDLSCCRHATPECNSRVQLQRGLLHKTSRN